LDEIIGDGTLAAPGGAGLPLGGLLERANGVQSRALRVLIVEDVPDDAEILCLELRRAGFVVTWSRVETEADYRKAVIAEPEIILADYVLPAFSAPRALRVLQTLGLDIPFVVVTGSADEERAVECMREGATDYLQKDRLARLGPAVSRALVEKALRDEKRRVERELRRSEERSRKIFDSSLDALIVSDGEGRIVDWNPQAEKTFGWRPAEVLGRPLVETLFPSRLRDETSGRLSASLRSGDGSLIKQRLETTALRRTGEEIPVEMTVTPFEVSEERNLAILARDLTESRRVEEERRILQARLLQAQRMEAVGLLASGVAHDFNNILTVVSGQCHLLLSEGILEDGARHRVEEIDRAAERASSLTRQLLAFSRRQVLQPTILDLNRVLSDMNAMLARVIGEDVVIQSDRATDLGHVKADRGQIEQVVINLAVNARDAMPRGGKLGLRTANVEVDENRARRTMGLRPGSYVALSVSDRGAGMTKEVLSRIFEPFYTTKELGRGTGLGLSTVYGIVKQSDGFIDVASAPGEGSTFEVLLPRVSEPLPKPAKTPALPLPGEGTILLVEDDDAVRRLTREILEQSGYRVLESADGREAFSAIEREEGNVDLVITDLVMPGMGGDEFAELLAARHPRIRVLYASGHLERPKTVPLIPKYRELIRKPFKSGELVRKVGELVDKP
jgi:PAS domain S-box-containing protein